MVHTPPHDNAVELADDALRGLLPAGYRLRNFSAFDLALNYAKAQPALSKAV